MYKTKQMASKKLVMALALGVGGGVWLSNAFAAGNVDTATGDVSVLNRDGVKESSENVTIRNAAAQEIQIRVADIAKREKRETSMMPEGLAGNLSLAEFAALLDYLEALAEK